MWARPESGSTVGVYGRLHLAPAPLVGARVCLRRVTPEGRVRSVRRTVVAMSRGPFPRAYLTFGDSAIFSWTHGLRDAVDGPSRTSRSGTGARRTEGSRSLSPDVRLSLCPSPSRLESALAHWGSSLRPSSVGPLLEVSCKVSPLVVAGPGPPRCTRSFHSLGRTGLVPCIPSAPCPLPPLGSSRVSGPVFRPRVRVAPGST